MGWVSVAFHHDIGLHCCAAKSEACSACLSIKETLAWGCDSTCQFSV